MRARDAWAALAVLSAGASLCTDPLVLNNTGRLAAGVPRSIAVTNDHLYIAAGITVRMLDRTRPGAPVDIGSIMVPGEARGVAYADGLLYIADERFGLLVYDLRDSGDPRLTGMCRMPDASYAVAVSSGIAFVAAGGSGVHAVAVGADRDPRLIGSYDTPGAAVDIAVQSGYAYVADGAGGLRVLDVRDPSRITETARASTGDYATAVRAGAGRIVVSDTWSGLVVYDASVPHLPVETGVFASSGPLSSFAIDGTTVYVVDSVLGLRTVRLAASGAPVTAGGECALPGESAVAAAAGGYACVATEDGDVIVVDVRDNRAPRAVARAPVPRYIKALAYAAGYLYVADRSDIKILRLSTGTPRYIGTLSVRAPVDLMTAGRFLFAVDVAGVLHSFALDDPAHPRSAGSCVLPGGSGRMASGRGRVWIACGAPGVAVCAVDGAGRPQVTATLAVPDEAIAVAVDGTRAYVAGRRTGVYVYDTGNPDQPVLSGALQSECGACDVVVSQGRVHVLDWCGLGVLDTTAPGSTRQAGVAAGGITRPQRMRAHAGDVVVLDGEAGVKVFDVRDRRAFRERASFNTPGAATDAVVAGGSLYVADYGTGLWIFDYPAADGPAARAPHTRGGPDATTLSGIVRDASGAAVADVTLVLFAGEVRRVRTDDQGRYTLDGITSGAGLLVPCRSQWYFDPPFLTLPAARCDFTAGPLELAVGGVTVHAGNAATVDLSRREPVRISFRPFRTGTVQVSLSGPDGRPVRTWRRVGASGVEQRIVWDGTDTEGRPAAPGLHEIRVSGAGMDTRRTLLVLP